MNQQQKQFNVILIGDNCIDEYQYGIVDRISPEAPVPIFVPTRSETKRGMAANVSENLQALGINVKEYLGQPCKKIRYIDERSKQQIVRVDYDVVGQPILAENILLECNAIVISDYNKGAVTYELIEQLRQRYVGPIFVDTKKQNLGRFNDCYVKINELEYKSTTSLNNNLIVTLGSRGAMYRCDSNERYFSSINVEVADVCGAGDTFLAALTWQYLTNGDIGSAIEFAIKASAITVQHTGVYAPKLEEII